MIAPIKNYIIGVRANLKMLSAIRWVGAVGVTQERGESNLVTDQNEPGKLKLGVIINFAAGVPVPNSLIPASICLVDIGSFGGSVRIKQHLRNIQGVGANYLSIS